LKLGIACFNAERNGVAMETLYRDECDGALDPANAARYPGMLRKALEIGGFRNVYFVSHRPEVAAQADHTIRISAAGTVAMEIG
jgi:DNA repair exonuclease SbcCD ATPase subunit